MQSYLIVFSNDTSIQILRAKKRTESYFFGGEYLGALLKGPQTVGREEIKIESNQLKISTKNCFSLTDQHQVRIIRSIQNVVTIYEQGKLTRTIYLDKKPIYNNPGQYVFPGGEKMPTETAEEAAKREFKEETGSDIDTDTHVLKTTTKYFNVNKQICEETGAAFSVTYLKIAKSDLLSLSSAINERLSKSDYQDRISEVTDDELETVENVELTQTNIDQFTISTDKRDLSWYNTAATYLKNNISALS